MKSAFRRRQTFFFCCCFLVELIQIQSYIYSRNETQTHRKMDSLRPQSHFYLFTFSFSLVVFIFMILSTVCFLNVHNNKRLLIVCPFKTLLPWWLWRRRRRRINNVIGASDERKKGLVQCHHVSGSWLMSVRLVSLRMTLIRSKESACRIRSICT